MSDTVIKSNVFVEDLALATGGTGAIETATRLTSTGATVTLTKIDLNHIRYRSVSGTPEDLVDGGQDIDIYPKDIDAGGNISADGNLAIGGTTTLSTLTPAGYVKNSVAGLLSSGAIAAVDLPTAIDAAKIADGSISNTEFQFLEGVASNIQEQINYLVTGTAVQAPFALLQNRQTQNTPGGTATTGSWLIIPLNTEQEDADGIVDSTALPAFSLVAGTYRIEATCSFYNLAARAQTRIYNVTDASVDIIGESIHCGAGLAKSSYLIGTITIAGTKQFRLEYRVGATATSTGLGAPGNFGTEVYAQLTIIRIA